MRIEKNEIPKPKKKSVLKTSVKVAKKIISTASTLAKPFGPTPTTVSLSLAAKLLSESNKKDQEDQNIAQINQLQKNQDNQSTKLIKKPGVFFIGGFQLFSSSPFGDGVKDMSNSMKDAQYFGWSNKKDILNEISKRSTDSPIMLIGHSLGGDTAVEIANELNTAKYQFRQVDLLATMDSFGFNNDIIGPNVIKNLNFISDDNSFLNDGPNIARNNHISEVINELRTESHTELDDHEDIQKKIFGSINQILKTA